MNLLFLCNQHAYNAYMRTIGIYLGESNNLESRTLQNRVIHTNYIAVNVELKNRNLPIVLFPLEDT